MSEQSKETARYAYQGLDRVIHERARLGILTGLLAHPDGLLFSELKALCGLTDGNLNRHLQVLEEAGFVTIHKGFRGRRPQTTCKATATGKERFTEYVKALEAVVADAAEMLGDAPVVPSPGHAGEG